MSFLRKAIISGMGTGYLPVAPGTWGSAAATIIFLVACYALPGAFTSVQVILLDVLAISSLGCVALGAYAEKAFGRKDPSQCTIDEWAGQSLTFLLLPLGTGPWTWWLAAGLGFVAFRFFDIVKVPPARQLEALPSGWGVLLDDLAAGVYANIVCQLILRLGFHIQ